jgi:hypothetical protein
LVKKSLTDEELKTYASDIADDNILVDLVYQEYVDSILVELPKVELSREEGTLDGLDSYVNMLDTYLPMIISSDTMTSEMVGDLSDHMDDVMTSIKTILIKNWMDDRNFLPGLSEFLTLDNEGKPKKDLLNDYSEFTEALTKVVLPHLRKLKRTATKVDDKLDKIDSGEDTADDAATDEPVDTGTDTVDDTTVDDAGDAGDIPADDNEDIIVDQ